MPSNVVWFERLMYGSLVIMILSSYLTLRREDVTGIEDIGISPELLLTVAVAIVALIWVLLIWLTARRRKGWARYVIAALFALSLFALVQGFSEALAFPLEGLLNVVQLLMTLAALILVFTGNAREWFEPAAPAQRQG
jgi:hypothetical protein